MNATFTNVTLLGQLNFNDGSSLSSTDDLKFVNVSGFERNLVNGTTSLLSDKFLLNNDIICPTKVISNNIQSNSIVFNDDVDLNGDLNVQTKAFTNLLKTDIETTKTGFNSLITDHFDRPNKRMRVTDASNTSTYGANFININTTSYTDTQITIPSAVTYAITKGVTLPRIVFSDSELQFRVGLTAGILFSDSSVSITRNIDMTGSELSQRHIYSTFFNVKDHNNNASRTSEIWQNNQILTLTNQSTSGRTRFVNSTASDSPTTTFEIDTTNTTSYVTSHFRKPVVLNSTTANERVITSSYYNISDINGNANDVSQLYQEGTTLNFFNKTIKVMDLEPTNGITFYKATKCSADLTITNGFSINLGSTTALRQTSSFGYNQLDKTQFIGEIQLMGNQNLTMVSGTGKISQAVTTADTSTKNNFKLSEFRFSGSTSGGGTAFEFYDSTNGKGLYLLPNSADGSLSKINQLNDCCLTSRGGQNANSITISNYNTNLRNGLRVYTTDSDNCGLTLQCGQNSTSDWTNLSMSYNRTTNTTTTTFNNVINFNPSEPAIPSTKRQLIGLGTLSFTDNKNGDSDGSTTSTIHTDSTLTSGLNGMYYQCNIDGGFHQFSARDSSGTLTTPIYYGSNLTSVSNLFILRNASVTSNRLDFSVSDGAITSVRARSTTSNTSAQISWACDFVSPTGTVSQSTVMIMTPFHTELRRPIVLNYSANPPSNATHIGFVTGPTAMTTGANMVSSASERNFGNFTIATIGTYSIQVVIGLAGNANHSLTESRWCLNDSSGTFPSTSTPTRYTPSITGAVGNSLSSVYTSYMNINLNLRTTTADQIIYVNYVLNYPGGSTTNINATYSFTRIG